MVEGMGGGGGGGGGGGHVLSFSKSNVLCLDTHFREHIQPKLS